MRATFLGVCLAALLPGCGGGGSEADAGAGDESSPPELEGTLVELVRAPLWQQVAAADDPFADHRPATIECPLGVGWLVEPGGLEVNTGACTYATFSQPSLAQVAPGAELSLYLFHFDLLAAEPATAHVAVQLGDRVVFEEEVAIPGKAAVYERDWVADFELPAGQPIYFHLHNHGQNTWTLAHIEVEVEDP